jgi:peptidoglycan/LPS O-acetylase OafA/YrhL
MATVSRIDVIDGLKGFAILLVLYQHIYASKVIELTGTRILFGYGYLSVTLFYILSGFLLYLPYATGRYTPSSHPALTTYYKKKILRLYPHLFICTLTLVIFAHRLDIEYVKSALLALTFTSQFVPSQFTPAINGGLWYLPVLVSFLLVFPLLIRLLLRSRKTFFTICASICIVAFFVRLVGAGYYTDNPFLSPYKDSIFGRMDDFMIGIMLCYLVYKYKWAHGLSRFKIYVMASLSALLFLVSNILLSLFLRNTSNVAYAAIANNFVQVSFCLLIVVAVSKGALQGVFNSQILRSIGSMSYSIFLWNIPIIAAVGHVKGRYIFLPFLVLGVAYLYHRIVDERLLSEGKNR